MARYQHVVSGAFVEVRDDKVMDSSWKPVSETKAPAKKSASSKSEK
jgi:hypothetical protein